MKKKCFGVFLISISIMLCGCSERMTDNAKQPVKKTVNQNQIEKKDFKTVFREAPEQEADIKKMADDHMEFSDEFYLNIPKSEEVSKICSFELAYKDKLSLEKTYESFNRILQQNFKGVYSEKEKKELYQVHSHDKDGKDAEGNLKTYYEPYETCKNDILNGNKSLDCFAFENKKGGLEVYPGKFFQMTHGVGARLDKDDMMLMYYPYYNHPIEKQIPITYQYQGKDTYPLMDQKISVKDAADFVEKFLEGVYEDDYILKPVVSSVRVVNMEKGFYDYCFSVTKKYQGIRFDCDPQKYASSSAQSSIGPNEEDYDVLPAKVQMIKSNEIDSMLAYSENYNFKEKEHYDDIIDLKTAMEILKKQVSSKLELVITNVDFVYSVYAKKESDQKKYGTPEWKISARNKKDKLDYYFYVNAVDGSFHYYYDTEASEN